MVRTESIKSLKTGQQAPSFTLKGVDGGSHSLEDFARSKTLLIVFMCNHCPYVKARVGDLVELQSQFMAKDLTIIGINSNDPEYDGEGFENMVAFARAYKLNFPYLIDDSQTVAKLYGAVCTPDPYLFDEMRRLVYQGRINDAINPEMTPSVHIMENNINKLLSGNSIEKDFFPSVGCSIKWIA